MGDAITIIACLFIGYFIGQITCSRKTTTSTGLGYDEENEQERQERQAMLEEHRRQEQERQRQEQDWYDNIDLDEEIDL